MLVAALRLLLVQVFGMTLLSPSNERERGHKLWLLFLSKQKNLCTFLSCCIFASHLHLWEAVFSSYHDDMWTAWKLHIRVSFPEAFEGPRCRNERHPLPLALASTLTTWNPNLSPAGIRGRSIPASMRMRATLPQSMSGICAAEAAPATPGCSSFSLHGCEGTNRGQHFCSSPGMMLYFCLLVKKIGVCSCQNPLDESKLRLSVTLRHLCAHIWKMADNYEVL